MPPPSRLSKVISAATLSIVDDSSIAIRPGWHTIESVRCSKSSSSNIGTADLHRTVTPKLVSLFKLSPEQCQSRAVSKGHVHLLSVYVNST
jgi:hypothetical protein